MICPSRTLSQVLDASRHIAADLASAALDLSADITVADRMALATLSLAVDAEASSCRAGVEPVAAPERRRPKGWR